ncbi:response regulator transcription factor [Falsihalocynthiibacter sp. S25ZX9]|uniref:response regulator transcription factor n=1 Tax=unclassified Falsihalocynthiibacter TaxID=2854191 RepID=UPI00350F8C9F
MGIPKIKTLLIVEDDDALRDRLAKAMDRRGFVTKTCSSVAEGLLAICQGMPDYLIADLKLLDGSGLDVVEFLKERNPKSSAVILTGFGNIPTAVAAARMGAVDYITKPATTSEIVDALMTPSDQRPPAPVNTLSPNEARLEHIECVFHEAGDNVSQAARLLSMHRRTLQRILKSNGVLKNAAQ